MKKLLIGNEAVARGLYEGGLHVVSSYPGTPSTEITEFLSKYDDITVYMTRTGVKDMSLLERAEFAKEVDADFLFCLHFNMSVNHKKYLYHIQTNHYNHRCRTGLAQFDTILPGTDGWTKIYYFHNL